ncbi:MAG: hypothetical protein KDD06_24920, partial [Phaeodactylibacter sp.]|nr:hypothetical protein [Phaeodactylibacter sp.]
MENLDIRALLYRILGYWYLFLLGPVIGLAAAKFYLRYAIPEYEISCSILLKDAKVNPGVINNMLSSASEFRSDLDNEMRLLRSPSLMEKVVEQLGLGTYYATAGRIRDTELYGYTPVSVDSFSLSEKGYNRDFRIVTLDNIQFRFEDGEQNSVH